MKLYINQTSPYGTKRSYNGGPVNSFHGGTDWGAPEGTPVRAPAHGTVILAENPVKAAATKKAAAKSGKTRSKSGKAVAKTKPTLKSENQPVKATAGKKKAKDEIVGG